MPFLKHWSARPYDMTQDTPAQMHKVATKQSLTTAFAEDWSNQWMGQDDRRAFDKDIDIRAELEVLVPDCEPY